MSKKLRAALLLFAVILLLTIAFWPKQAKQPINMSTNVVSMKDQNSEVNLKKAPQSLVVKSPQEQNSAEQRQAVHEYNKSKELNYLELYRQYQWAQLCQPYFGVKTRFHTDKSLLFDYSAHYLARINARKRQMGEPETTPEAQLKTLDAYMVACEQAGAIAKLFEDSYQINEDNGHITPVKLLLHVLQDMDAETAKEQGIKTQLIIKNDIATKQAEIIALHQGENTWTDAQIAAQEEEIKNVMSQVVANSQNTDESEELKRLLKTLMQQLASQKQKDKTAIHQSISQLEVLFAQANAALNSTDFDVFYLAKTTSEMQEDYSGLGVLWYDFFRKEYGVDYTTPGERMLQLLGMSERHVLNQAAVPAGVLYLCALGEDCSADGMLMTSYCLGFGGFKMTEAACGKDLVTFYNSGYVTPALMQDVQLIMELMEVEYGS